MVEQTNRSEYFKSSRLNAYCSVRIHADTYVCDSPFAGHSYQNWIKGKIRENISNDVKSHPTLHFSFFI